MFEKWRTKKLEGGAKAATVNLNLAIFQSCINWGVRRGLIKTNPLTQFERLKESDSRTIVRYLSEDERERLEAALLASEERL